MIIIRSYETDRKIADDLRKSTGPTGYSNENGLLHTDHIDGNDLKDFYFARGGLMIEVTETNSIPSTCSIIHISGEDTEEMEQAKSMLEKVTGTELKQYDERKFE